MCIGATNDGTSVKITMLIASAVLLMPETGAALSVRPPTDVALSFVCAYRTMLFVARVAGAAREKSVEVTPSMSTANNNSGTILLIPGEPLVTGCMEAKI
jgi:hypothetical protein